MLTFPGARSQQALLPHHSSQETLVARLGFVLGERACAEGSRKDLSAHAFSGHRSGTGHFRCAAGTPAQVQPPSVCEGLLARAAAASGREGHMCEV